MKTALLNREDCNVILVDWSKGAKWPYGQASGNARLVGAQTAELIKFLNSSSSGSPGLDKRFYIVGFSLGAHVAGHAGSYLRAQGMKLDRITGNAFKTFPKDNPLFKLVPWPPNITDVMLKFMVLRIKSYQFSI